MHVTIFTGGKTDVFPNRSESWDDPVITLQEYATHAPGLDKSEAGFVCFVRMKPGTDLTVAEINLGRAKEQKPALNGVQEACVRERGYRNYAHVAEVTAIGIDYDEFPNEQPDWNPESWPCDVFAHSTHNYHPTERPGKWRAILPLATPMPVEREAQLRKVLQGFLPRGCLIRAPHQPAFLPTCDSGATVQVVHVEQDRVPAKLDWTQLVDMAEAPTVHASGEAGATLLGAEFDRRGMVQRDLGTKLDVVCPWAHEHKSGGDLGYLYFSDDGLGKFGCAHGACVGRGSTDVYELWEGTASPVSEPVSQPITGGEPVAPPVNVSRFIGWPSIMEPLGSVPWLIKDLEICPGRPPMFISDSGVGKTWALQAMALAALCSTSRATAACGQPRPATSVWLGAWGSRRRTSRCFRIGWN
jgi:hypothetical protein